MIQTITTRLDHEPSNDHVHRWRQWRVGVPEQCGYGMCQAISSVTYSLHHCSECKRHARAGGEQWGKQSVSSQLIKEATTELKYPRIRQAVQRMFRDIYGPPTYDNAPSDIYSFCGGSRPCMEHSLHVRELAREQLLDLID